MTTESKIDPPIEPSQRAATVSDVSDSEAGPPVAPQAAAQESLPAAEVIARKVPNKGLLLAVAFGLALLVAAGALLVGLNKL